LRARLEPARDLVLAAGDGQSGLEVGQLAEEIDVAQQHRRLGQNGDRPGVVLAGERRDDTAREPVLGLDALVGIGHRADEDRAPAPLGLHPRQLALE
jgi:hypothetical protein